MLALRPLATTPPNLHGWRRVPTATGRQAAQRAQWLWGAAVTLGTFPQSQAAGPSDWAYRQAPRRLHHSQLGLPSHGRKPKGRRNCCGRNFERTPHGWEQKAG